MNASLNKFIETKFTKPGKALDLGAGQFFDVVCLRQLGWECDGVDIKTGVNLEEPYLSANAPYDLVYSNYVIHKLKNQINLLKTAFDNLKDGGSIFLHTFDKSDANSKSTITEEAMKTMLLQQGFKNISTKIFDFYDNDEGHKHWHKILEASAEK